MNERDQLLERLQHLRTIVPVFARELAESRRQAAGLRLENAQLRRRLALLVEARAAPARSAAEAVIRERHPEQPAEPTAGLRSAAALR